MSIFRGNQDSIGVYGWRERDYSDPTTYSVGIYGWLGYEGLISGITSDPTFEYLYVHPYASGAGNGFSWHDAYNNISDAINTLSSGLLIEKHVDATIFGLTGTIILSGIIEKIAVASEYVYNDNIIIDGTDDNRITIEGGFFPPSPLPSSYVALESSGTNTVVKSTGLYFGSGLYITQPGEYNISKFTFKDFDYAIFSTGNYVELNEINVSGCKIPVELKSVEYNINEININNTGKIDCNFNFTNSTGSIFNSSVNSGHYGLKSISGQLRYCASNVFNACGTGLYVVDNIDETIYIGEGLNGNLFSNNHVGLYLDNIDFDANHNTIYATSGIYLDMSTGTYDNGIVSFYGNSIYTPLVKMISSQLLVENGCLYTPTYATGNYDIDSNSLIMLSGRILHTDPGFTQPESGDFRLDITSKCLNQAEVIRIGDYTHYPINTHAVKIIDDYGDKLFNEYRDHIKVLDNSIVYINPISGYSESELYLNINEKKTISDKIIGISSFDINSGDPSLYPYDYKIISKFDNKKRIEEYYLVPYTIFELKPLLDKYVNDPIQILSNINKENIEVKTDYRFSNIAYDNRHGYDSASNEVFYMLEKNNQYLIKIDMMKNKELNRYYLMRPDSSGINYKSVVYPSGMRIHKELNDGYEFNTTQYQEDKGALKEKYITCLNKEGAIKWLPTDVDMDTQSGNVYRDVRGLTIYDGNLYYLIAKHSDNSLKYTRDLISTSSNELINVDLDDEIGIEKIKSGQLINMDNPVSMAVNRDNELIILNNDVDSSGNFYCKTYKFKYDYMLIDKQTDNTNRMYFREEYPNGVNI